MGGFVALLNKFNPGVVPMDTPGGELPPAAPHPLFGNSVESFIQKFSDLTEEYKFYKDTVTLRFNKKEHRYYRVGELGNLIPLNGVTTTVGIIDKSNMLTPWAAKMAIQKLLRMMPTEMDKEGVIRIKALSFEEFTTIALEAKSAHKDKLEEAGDIGQAAHKCLEDSINFALQNDPEKKVRSLINIPTDERAANGATGGFAWMQKHNVRWVETESKIYSKEFDYAGTCDGICIVDSCDDVSCCPVPFKDRRSMADWKSSNYLKIEYLFQVCAYKHAKLEEFPELPIEDIWILRLGKSEEEAGKFESWHTTADEYEEDFAAFEACLRLTRLVDSVEERMKERKATIRGVKKMQRESAKAIAKEKEKLDKAIAKANAKVEREKEKARIKAEAKAERERLKVEKKTGVIQCTSTSKAQPESSQSVSSAPPAEIQCSSGALTGEGGTAKAPTQAEKPLPQESTISTVEMAVPSTKKTNELQFETEAPIYVPTLPMEG